MREGMVLIFVVLSCASGRGEPGNWSWTGDLQTPRLSHTLTALLDGRVLAIGGEGILGPLRSTELYDPITGDWDGGRPSSAARSEHTATLLLDGRVLVVGGQSGGEILSSAELYHPVTDSWEAAGSLSVARAKHTATLLSNGHVLVVGGFGPGGQGALNTAEIFNPLTGAWAPTADLNMARESHTSTLLSKGKVLVAGGFSAIVVGQFSRLRSVETYDPQTGTWSMVQDMKEPRANHTATLLSGGSVLIAGGPGASAELYDPVSQGWVDTGLMQSPRSSHSATRLSDGRVLVTGGSDQGGLNRSELLDPASGRWSTQGDLNSGRAFHAATLLPTGEVLVAGGRQTGTPLTTAELYEPGVAVAPARLVYPQLALGGGFEISLFLTNMSDSDWVGRVDLDAGMWPGNRPWSLGGEDRTGTSSFEVQLSARETMKYVLSSASGPFSGWIEILGSNDSVVSDLSTAFFYNFSTGSQLVDSTGVDPASPATAFWFPVERSGSLNTGIAIRRAPEILVFSLYRQDGTLLQQTQQGLQEARFFSQVFSGVPMNFVGSVKVESGVSFYLTVLRQAILSDAPLQFQLTSIPARELHSSAP